MNAVQYKLINLLDPPLVLLGCFTINAALTGNLNLPSFEKNLHLEHATYAVSSIALHNIFIDADRKMKRKCLSDSFRAALRFN